MLFLLSTLCFADTQQGGFGMTDTTPQVFSNTLGYVQRLVIRVVPGYCGKIFIGKSGLNTTTFANTIKILYPNCYGGLSDEYVIQDVTGANGIDANQFYVAGQNYGDYYTWETYKSTVTPTQHLELAYNPGPCNFWNGIAQCPVMAPHSNFSVIQINIVPGQSGKIHILSPTTVKSLWPNNGTVTGNITDKWERYAVNPNGLDTIINVQRDVSGEFPLVAIWKHQ